MIPHWLKCMFGPHEVRPCLNNTRLWSMCLKCSYFKPVSLRRFVRLCRSHNEFPEIVAASGVS